MQKKYVLDTNVLLDDENAIKVLRNGEENQIFIPPTVLNELDGLKKDPRVSYKVARVTAKLLENVEIIQILNKTQLTHKRNDDQILFEISSSGIADLVFVSNDKLLRFKATKMGIKAEEYKSSNPFLSESQRYKGFIQEGDELVNNCFYWKDGKMIYNQQGEEKLVDYENVLWTLKPKTPYQNALMELIKDPAIEVISVQSEAGFGKTALSLAGAVELFMKEKEDDRSRTYKKIYVFRPNAERGEKLGFLPGDIDEKMDPYFRPIRDLMEKLHEQKAINKIWRDPKATELEFNKRKFEMMPINYLRGMNLESCICIIDEAQNLSRDDARTILSRMGQRVKVIITGDVNQIDSPYLNADNNMLSWVVSKFKGAKSYGHIVLTGKHSRGPIADLVRTTGL